jgi:hypothetical protein
LALIALINCGKARKTEVLLTPLQRHWSTYCPPPAS